MFEPLLGNAPVKAYLSQAIEQSRLPHALLFSGIDGIGKSLFAKHLAATLLQSPLHRLETGNHPDFYSLSPEGKVGLHSIDTLRLLIDHVHSAPFEAPGKVFLIQEADRMQPAAANALLKTLEEPNPDTTLILLTSNPRDILPTILSRCIRLSFLPLADAEIRHLLKEKGHPEHFAKLAQGSAGKAFDLATRPSLEESLFTLLSQRPPYPVLIDALEKIEELADDEDPVRKGRNVESLLSAILMWFRDQHARQLGLDTHLFFPHYPLTPHSLPPLEKIEKSLSQVRLAISRNIRLSVSLFPIFSSY